MNSTDTPDTIDIFEPFGIPDGRVLVNGTITELTYTAPKPQKEQTTTDHLRHLGHAFRRAFTKVAEVPVICEALSRAIEEAVGTTIHTYLGKDADLETTIVPTFYRYVVSFFRSLIEMGVDSVAGIYLENSEGG